MEKQVPTSVDADGAWSRKAGKLRYGYKKYHVTDEERLVLGVVTTATDVNEISNLEGVLQRADLPENIPVKADIGDQKIKKRDQKSHNSKISKLIATFCNGLKLCKK